MIKILNKFIRRGFASPPSGLMNMSLNLKTKGINDVFLQSADGDLLIKDPVKVAVASLAGCELHTMNFYARKRNIKIEGVTISDVSAVIDLDGFKGVEGHTADIKEVAMKIDVQTTGDAAAVEQLHRDVAKHCFIYNLFVKAGVNMNIQFRKA